MTVGTDIHMRVEKRDSPNHPWQVVAPGPQPYPYEEGKTREDWPSPRNYMFFALVANVRNGFGFAGVYTHDAITPISEPRGLPKDMASSEYADGDFEKYEDADAAGLSNLGDHSFTYLSLKELQEGLSNFRGVKQGGWVSIPTLAGVEKLGDAPESWSGGVGGRVVKVPMELGWAMSRLPSIVEISAHVYTEYHWTSKGEDTISDAYKRLIFEEWPKLGDPDNVRVIMGFDS